MDISVTSQIYLYLGIIFTILSFVFYFRSRRRRKKELEERRSLSSRFKVKKKNREVV